MESPRVGWTPLVRGLALASGVVVSFGSYLPWVRVASGISGPIPDVGLTGMNSGLETLGMVLIPLSVLGTVATLRWPTDRRVGLGTFTVGGVVVAVTVHFALTIPFGHLVPDHGVYVTIFGGLLFAITGTVVLFTAPSGRPPPTPTTT